MATYTQAFTPRGGLSQPAPLSTGGVQAISATSTTQNYALGTKVVAVDPVLGEGEFIYCAGVAATAIGTPVQINADFTTVVAVGGTAKGHIGVAMSACVASNYGWYCIKGRCFGVIAADVAAAARASIVAGVFSDAATATKQVPGASLAISLLAGGSAIVGTTDTTPAALAVVYLLYPQAVVLV